MADETAVKRNRTRKYIVGMLLLVICIALYFVGRSFIFSQIKRKVIAGLESLKEEGVFIQYGSLETDPWKKSLIITNAEIKFNVQDSACVTSATLPKIEIDGIELLPLLFRHELSLDVIFLDRPSVHALNNFRRHKRMGQKKQFLKGIRINRLQMNAAAYDLKDSTSCEIIAGINLDMNAWNLHISMGDHAALETSGEVIMTGIKASFPKQFYNLTVKQILYNTEGKLFKVDSVKIDPMYSRAEFAKKADRQIDQLTCTIPFIKASGFEIGNRETRFCRAQRIDMNFSLEAFRDKRIARKPRKPTMLPVRFLQGLPFQLQIDSLAIADSHVSYEEFPETGNASGKIFFKNLNAGIANISNYSAKGATMHVHTYFMNTGDLKATFTFPVAPKDAYTARGSLRNFSIPEINSMLMPVAHAQIESGNMKEMKFDFQYNDFQSDGEVELYYTDLKLHSLKKNPEKSVNKLLTFLLDIFVEKDLDKHDDKKKRTGIIHFERDPQRSIFNYWWKSISSGVKSQFGFNKSSHKSK